MRNEVLRPEDLMVGDWVLLFDETPVRVDCIGNIEVYLTEPRGQHELDWHVTYERIKPIPLTDKILEKNGFIFVKGWWEIPRLPNGHGYVAIAFDPDGKGRPTNTIYDLDVSQKESGSADLHLNYVHELQHALRLARIDKEIVL